MSWSRVDVNHNPEGRPWVKIGCHGRRSGYEQIKITLSRSMVRSLGLKPGDKVELYRGTDEHAGWVGLCKGPNGFTSTDYRQGNGNLAIRCSARFLEVTGIHSTTKIDCDSVVSGELNGMPCLYIGLPAWCTTGADRENIHFATPAEVS